MPLNSHLPFSQTVDVLEGHGHAVAATALNSRPVIVDGSPTTGRLADLMNTDGVLKVFDRYELVRICSY